MRGCQLPAAEPTTRIACIPWLATLPLHIAGCQPQLPRCGTALILSICSLVTPWYYDVLCLFFLCKFVFSSILPGMKICKKYIEKYDKEWLHAATQKVGFVSRSGFQNVAIFIGRSFDHFDLDRNASDLHVLIIRNILVCTAKEISGGIAFSFA